MALKLNIPSLPSSVDVNVRRAIEAIKAFVTGQSSDIDALSASIASQGVAASDGTIVDPQIISSIPPQPLNVTATGGFAKILIQWDDPNYKYFSYAEVYRNTSNNLGTAVMIGTSNGQMYSDDPPNSSIAVTYYYWVRFVSTAAIKGGYSAVASAHTASDPTYALEILTAQLSEDELNSQLNSRINLIDTPTIGVVDKMDSLAQSVLDGIPDSYGHYLDLKWQQAVTDAVIEVDPLTGKIKLKATAELTTDAEHRVTVVEQSMDAVSGTIASHTATLATHGTDILANSTLIGQQQGQIDLMATSAYVDGKLADVSASLDPAAILIGQDLAAEATLWGLLTSANIAHANMQFRSNADAISAEAAVRTLLAAKVDDNLAALVSESLTRANADSAEAEARLALAAIVNDPVTGLAATKAALENNYYTKAQVDSASAGWITEVISQAGSATSSALLNYYTKTAADSAISSAVSAVSSVINHPTTGLATKAGSTELSTANSTLTSAVALAIRQTSTTLNGTTTSLETQMESIDGIQGKYSVKVDNNGYVSGFGLISTANNGTPTSSFQILADKFVIAPTAAAPSGSSPFFVLTSRQTVNGVSLPAGTYLNSLFVGNATITNAMIGSLAADKLTVPGTASIWDAIITTGKITNLYIGDTIQSSDWNGSSLGWQINKAGGCVFNNVKVRGDVEATSLKVDAVNVVNTLHIANNAISIPVGQSVGSQAVSYATVDWTDAVTVQITVPEGESFPLSILATMEGFIPRNLATALNNGNTGVDAYIQMRVVVNTTQYGTERTVCRTDWIDTGTAYSGGGE